MKLHVVIILLEEIVNPDLFCGQLEFFDSLGLIERIKLAFKDACVVERSGFEPFAPTAVGDDDIVGSFACGGFL